jgi:hypothetical protein
LQPLATAMIAALTDRLRADGYHTVFLGTLASESPSISTHAWASTR